MKSKSKKQWTFEDVHKTAGDDASEYVCLKWGISTYVRCYAQWIGI